MCFAVDGKTAVGQFHSSGIEHLVGCCGLVAIAVRWLVIVGSIIIALVCERFLVGRELGFVSEIARFTFRVVPNVCVVIHIGSDHGIGLADVIAVAIDSHSIGIALDASVGLILV